MRQQPLLPIHRHGGRYLATLELDAEECEALAYALGLNDAGAQQLLDTAFRMQDMAKDDER